ncbi:MAG: hypothetical protein PHQ98_01635 [Candidatus ainarchaeum sp.]|nr:hypothetical protein [Candidatus ainarchaeum sp.]
MVNDNNSIEQKEQFYLNENFLNEILIQKMMNKNNTGNLTIDNRLYKFVKNGGFENGAS